MPYLRQKKCRKGLQEGFKRVFHRSFYICNITGHMNRTPVNVPTTLLDFHEKRLEDGTKALTLCNATK
jgi:hypothetical protein